MVGRAADGALVCVADIARVEDGFRERVSITRLNGQESIGLLVKKEAMGNAVQVSRRVRQVLEELRKEHPGLEIAVAYDQAEFIANAISNVKQAIIAGGLLALSLLFFFLHDLRQPFTVGLSMPLSILAALVIFCFAGVNLNLMSLGGLALGIGMLVDNSIVVLENIFRHRELGQSTKEATILGAQEVAMPVLASTLTTVAVFLPIVYAHGVAGKLFRDQALAVAFSLLASLVLSLTLLPMLISRLAEGKRRLPRPSAPQATESRGLARLVLLVWQRMGAWLRHGGPTIGQAGRFALVQVEATAGPVFACFDRIMARTTELYEIAEGWVLKHRWPALAVIVGILLVGSAVALTLPREFMPRVDQGEFLVEVEAPVGATLEATAARAAQVEKWLLAQPEVEAVFSTIGLIEDPLAVFTEEAALHRAKVHVRLKRKRGRRTWDLMADLRDCAPRLVDARVEVKEAANTLQQLPGTSEPAVAIKIQGEDLAICKELTGQVKRRLAALPGLKALQESWQEASPELRVQIDRDRAGRYGLSAGEVARFIQNSVKGRVATQFKDFDLKIDVLVRPRPEDRDEIEDLLGARLHASTSSLPLRELIDHQYVQDPTEIRREDQVRELLLVGAVGGRAVGDVLRDIQGRVASIRTPPDYRVVVRGEREEIAQSFRSLGYALLLSVAPI